MKNKITWKDLKNKNIAIHTPSKRLMVKVINVIANKYGDVTYEQNKINLERDGDSCPDIYYADGKDACVELTYDKWNYGNIEWYEDKNYKIVEYEDVKRLFEDCIDITETEEVKYLAKVKLKNGKEGYFMEEWEQGEHWIFPAEDIKYADTYANLTTLKEILDMYKEEIEEYEIIKQTTTTTRAFAFIE